MNFHQITVPLVLINILFSGLTHKSHGFSLLILNPKPPRLGLNQIRNSLQVRNFKGSQSQIATHSEFPNNSEIFEAEEEAAFDAHDLSDAGVEAAAMERAVMMAYDIMKTKRMELKELVEEAKSTEQQYVMMAQATQDLARKYKATPSSYIPDYSNDNSNLLAMKMLEKAIVTAAEEIIEAELNEDSAVASFYVSLEEDQKKNVKTDPLTPETKVSRDINKSVKTSIDKQDMGVLPPRSDRYNPSHSAKKLIEEVNFTLSNIKKKEKEVMLMQEKLNNSVSQLQREKDLLRAEVNEIKKIVQNQVVQEVEHQ